MPKSFKKTYISKYPLSGPLAGAVEGVSKPSLLGGNGAVVDDGGGRLLHEVW